MENSPDAQNLIHNLDSNSETKSFTLSVFFSILISVILLGIITGFFLGSSNKASTKVIQKSGSAKLEKTAGIADKKTFKDKAEGILKEGGIEGEGNFHLERPGGKSQNVYLTSTTVDLSLYVGKKVKVWGQTFSGEKAGWLMDVGLVEVLK